MSGRANQRPRAPESRERLTATPSERAGRHHWQRVAARLCVSALKFHEAHPDLLQLLDALCADQFYEFRGDDGRVMSCPDDEELWGPSTDSPELDRLNARAFRRDKFNFAPVVPQRPMAPRARRVR